MNENVNNPVEDTKEKQLFFPKSCNNERQSNLLAGTPKKQRLGTGVLKCGARSTAPKPKA